MTDTQQYNILLVEDNPSDARLIEEYLKDRLAEAANGHRLGSVNDGFGRRAPPRAHPLNPLGRYTGAWPKPRRSKRCNRTRVGRPASSPA